VSVARPNVVDQDPLASRVRVSRIGFVIIYGCSIPLQVCVFTERDAIGDAAWKERHGYGCWQTEAYDLYKGSLFEMRVRR